MKTRRIVTVLGVAAIISLFAFAVAPAKLGDFTTANAFYWSDADLAAYAGTDAGSTPYKIVLTDALGKTATGYLGAAGAGESTTEVLTDGGLENWLSATNLTSWTEILSGTSTVNRESVVVDSGTYSCRMDVSAAADNVRIVQTGIVLVPSGLHRLTIRNQTTGGGKFVVYVLGATSGLYLQVNGTWAATPTAFAVSGTTSWATFSLVFNALAADSACTVTLGRSNLTPGCSLYFDNISLVRITDPDSTGLHVMSAYNGVARGWAATDSGFDPIQIASETITKIRPKYAAVLWMLLGIR